jgi:hypothetical protein
MHCGFNMQHQQTTTITQTGHGCVPKACSCGVLPYVEHQLPRYLWILLQLKQCGCNTATPLVHASI